MQDRLSFSEVHATATKNPSTRKETPVQVKAGRLETYRLLIAVSTCTDRTSLDFRVLPIRRPARKRIRVALEWCRT